MATGFREHQGGRPNDAAAVWPVRGAAAGQFFAGWQQIAAWQARSAGKLSAASAAQP